MRQRLRKKHTVKKVERAIVYNQKLEHLAREWNAVKNLSDAQERINRCQKAFAIIKTLSHKMQGFDGTEGNTQHFTKLFTHQIGLAYYDLIPSDDQYIDKALECLRLAARGGEELGGLVRIAEIYRFKKKYMQAKKYYGLVVKAFSATEVEWQLLDLKTAFFQLGSFSAHGFGGGGVDHAVAEDYFRKSLLCCFKLKNKAEAGLVALEFAGICFNRLQAGEQLEGELVTKCMTFAMMAMNNGQLLAAIIVAGLYMDYLPDTDENRQAKCTALQRAIDEENIAQAKHLLGCHYEFVVKDYAQAIDWYKKAIEDGVSDSMHNLAGFYSDGKVEAQDYERTVALLTRAYNLGHVEAAVDLYVNIGRSEVLSKQPEMIRLGRRALNFALKKRSVRAYHNLGVAYLSGERTSDDVFLSAMKAFEFPAKQNYLPSKINLAICGLVGGDSSTRQVSLSALHNMASEGYSELTNILVSIMSDYCHRYQQNPDIELRNDIAQLHQIFNVARRHEHKEKRFENDAMFITIDGNTPNSVAAEFQLFEVDDIDEILDRFARMSKTLCIDLNKELMELRSCSALTASLKFARVLNTILGAKEFDEVNLATATLLLGKIAHQYARSQFMIKHNVLGLQQLFKKLSRHSAIIKSASCQLQVFDGLTRLGIAPDCPMIMPCLDAILDKIFPNVGGKFFVGYNSMSDKDSRYLLYLVARVGVYSDVAERGLTVLMDVLFNRGKAFGGQLTDLQLVQSLHNLAILHCNLPKAKAKVVWLTFHGLMEKAQSRLTECGAMDAKMLHQWYMVLYYHELCRVSDQPSIYTAFAAYFKKNPPHLLVQDGLQGSQLQSEVAEMLGEMMGEYVEEYPRHGLFVDIHCRGVNVQVDGPTHFYFYYDPISGNIERMVPTPKDRFHDRLLDCEVVHIDYREWGQADEQARRAIIRERVAVAGPNLIFKC